MATTTLVSRCDAPGLSGGSGYIPLTTSAHGPANGCESPLPPQSCKGSVGTFGRSESFTMASALEQNGISGAMEGTGARFLSLELGIADLERDLTGFCA